MSWINFQNLIENLDKNIEHWQSAIEANPNTPEDALKVAIMKIFETKDMQSLDDLCSCVVYIVREAAQLRVQADEGDSSDEEDFTNPYLLSGEELERTIALRH